VKVAVLGGGRSSEHDVSLASAESVRAGLEEGGHEPVEVVVEPDGRWTHAGSPLTLEPSGGLLGVDAVFPALHGPFGEDGTVQGLLDLLDVPYVGAGVLASAVSMDKPTFKELMGAHGVPQGDYAVVRSGGPPTTFGPPAFVKPARLGSSVGIVRVGETREIEGALQTAFAHDPRVIVEASATGLEVECSVLGHTTSPEASEPGEIVLRKGEGWYDYEAKYAEGGMELVVPARITDAARERVRDIAVTAFRLAGCSGLARADFFVDGDEVLLNELNTMPGFTPTSVYAKLWECTGVPYPELVDRLVRIAVERFEAERAHRF
jgi:D-alanine-D-alanine ligase